MLILEYIASNRNSLIQPIEKSTGKHYKVVFEAVKRLTDRGLLQIGKEVKSCQGYELSKHGLAFLWAYSPNKNPIKASLRNYEDMTLENDNRNLAILERELEKEIPDGLMFKVLRLTGFSILNYGEQAIDIHNQFANIINKSMVTPTVTFTPSEARRLKRLGLLIPETTQHLKKMRDNLDELLNSRPEDFNDGS